jgi:hypothetical protein
VYEISYRACAADSNERISVGWLFLCVTL